MDPENHLKNEQKTKSMVQIKVGLQHVNNKIQGKAQNFAQTVSLLRFKLE